MARVKKRVFSNVTLEQAQEASQQVAANETSLAKLEARMNEDINRVKSKYQEEITELKEANAEPMEVLEVFAAEQKESWGKKKSFELLHCIIGFRTGTPKVCKDKKFTWDAVLELVKKNKSLSKLFIRTKEELDKEAILATKNDGVLGQLKEEAFIYVDQDETFFVTPKKEEVTA